MFIDSATLTDAQYDAQFVMDEQEHPEPTDAELDAMYAEWLAEEDARHVLYPEPW